MLKNLTIKARLTAVLSLLALLMAAISVAGAYALGQTNQALRSVYDDRLVAMGQLDGVIRAVNRNQLLIASAISGAPESLPAVVDAVEKNRRQANDLWQQYSETVLTEEEKKLAKRFGEARALFVKEALAPAIQAARAADRDAMAKLLHGKLDTHYQAVRNELDQLIRLQLRVGKQLYSDSQHAYERFRWMVFSALLFGIAAAAGIGWWLVRSITRPLNHAVGVAQAVAQGNLTRQVQVHGNDETGRMLAARRDMNHSLAGIVGNVRSATDAINTAASEIADGNLDLSVRTEQQASSLEETASSMEELTSTVRQNADNAQQANQLALSASEVAGRGGQAVAQLVDKMGAINESAYKIAEINAVIDSIAFQTNILALNAAVEAARAGEQGRGFAVVASEVRNLAQRSAGAAKEIKELIDHSVSQVEEGSRLAGQAGLTMQEVVGSVQRVHDIISDISAASAEQRAGIEQINEAVVQMDNVTQQNAALVEQAAAAAAAMQEQARSLAQAVSQFETGGMAGDVQLATVTRLQLRRSASKPGGVQGSPLACIARSTSARVSSGANRLMNS